MELLLASSLAAVTMAFIMYCCPPVHSLRDLAWLSGSSEVSIGESKTYFRYLTRVHRARYVGCWLGVLFALTVAIRYYQQVSFGIGTNSVLADPLFCGMAGMIGGHLWAEQFRLTTPKTVVVTASLSKKSPKTDWQANRLALALIAGSLLVGLGALVWNGTLIPMFCAGFGSIVYAMSVRTASIIASRSQPALSERASRVNGRIRDVGSASNDNIKLAVGWLTFGWTFGQAAESVSDTQVAGIGDLFLFGTGLTCLVVSIVYLWRAKLEAPRNFTSYAVVV